jgi:hypothetical protein
MGKKDSHWLRLRYLFDLPGFAQEVLGWTPDERQREALEYPGRRVALNWARQCGKSTVFAIKAVHVAFTQPGSTVLILGGDGNHLAESFAKIDDFLLAPEGGMRRGYAEGAWWVGGPVKTHWTGKRIARILPNGSRIVGATKDRGVRGPTTALVILDEAGTVEDRVFVGVLPTLSVTRGSIWVGGTPNGTKGFYYDIWMSKPEAGVEGWLKSKYRATENPRIPESFLAEVKARVGVRLAAQELECEFVRDGMALLDPEDIDKLFVTRR